MFSLLPYLILSEIAAPLAQQAALPAGAGKGEWGRKKTVERVGEKQVGWGRGRGRELFVLSC